MFVSVTGGQPFIQRRDAFCVWVDAAVELRLAIHVAKTGLTCLRQYKGCEELLINLVRDGKRIISYVLATFMGCSSLDLDIFSL